MRYQQPLELTPPAGSAQWIQQTPFGGRILDDIADVNGGFVGLAVELHASRPGSPVLGLPAHVLARLARRAGPGAAGLRLPFVLFDLRFRDTGFWRGQVEGAASIRDGEAARLLDPRLVRYSRTALMLGWHLSQADPQAARLALGLGSVTRALLAGLSVGALDGLARRVASALVARFSARERFWSLVVEAVGPGGDPACLDRARLLGLQLQGAEAARAQQLYRRGRRSAQA